MFSLFSSPDGFASAACNSIAPAIPLGMQLGEASSRHSTSVCYVVPSHTAGESTHFAHLPRFLNELARFCDVHVVVQRGSSDMRIPHARSVFVQRGRNHLSRALELLWRASWIRRQGCTRFFVRISASAAFVLGLTSRVLGIRLYYWVSGQGRDMKPGWAWRTVGQRLRWEINEWLLRVNMLLSHRFVTGPPMMAQYFVREYGIDPNKVIVVSNDVDIESFRPASESIEALRARLGLPVPSPVILFVGRVSRLKGGHYLIPIAQMLLRGRADALVVAVGAIQLQDVARRAGSEGLRNLRFLGPRPNSEIVDYYRAADILILPSESEGFPRVLLEAMACGLPIVAFDVGGIREIVAPEQLPYVVPRGDVKTLVDRTLELSGDRDLRAAQGMAGRRRVADFSTENVARMFFERIVRE